MGQSVAGGCCNERNQTCNMDYIQPGTVHTERMIQVRNAFRSLEDAIRPVLQSNRESSVCFTNVEQALMWAIKSCAVDSKFDVNQDKFSSSQDCCSR